MNCFHVSNATGGEIGYCYNYNDSKLQNHAIHLIYVSEKSEELNEKIN
jgi:hypothetical protein